MVPIFTWKSVNFKRIHLAPLSPTQNKKKKQNRKPFPALSPFTSSYTTFTEHLKCARCLGETNKS